MKPAAFGLVHVEEIPTGRTLGVALARLNAQARRPEFVTMMFDEEVRLVVPWSDAPEWDPQQGAVIYFVWPEGNHGGPHGGDRAAMAARSAGVRLGRRLTP